MSELISSKEAKLAWASGKDLEFKIEDNSYFYKWTSIICRDADLSLSDFDRDDIIFRLKPRTITLNGIEVPAPFGPKDNCIVYILDDSKTDSYRAYNYEHDGDNINSFISMWESEEEIKQVVDALRSVFK